MKWHALSEKHSKQYFEKTQLSTRVLCFCAVFEDLLAWVSQLGLFHPHNVLVTGLINSRIFCFEQNSPLCGMYAGVKLA